MTISASIDSLTAQVIHIKRELAHKGFTLLKCSYKPAWFVCNDEGESYAIEYRPQEKRWIAARLHGTQSNLSAIRQILNQTIRRVQ